MTKFSVPSLSWNHSRVYLAVIVAAIGLLSPQAGQTQSGTAGEQVQYPGPMPPSGKVEGTLGPARIRFYGTL